MKAHGQAGLDGRLAVFTELAGGPTAEVGAAIRKNATRKYQDFLRWRPAVFVAVAPGVREFLDVDYHSGSAVLQPRQAGGTEAELTPPAG